MPVFLIDTNCLITAKNNYYPFDFAPGFWMQLKKHMDDGDVLVLKEVYDELLRQDDELAGWVKENCQNCQISISDLPSMLKYQLVLEYIESCD